jgi:hypothetical protein
LDDDERGLNLNLKPKRNAKKTHTHENRACEKARKSILIAPFDVVPQIVTGVTWNTPFPIG